MNFNEIMQMNIFDLEGVELEFHECHNRIMSYGYMAAENILMLSKNLSEMKTKKLFKAAGFDSFGAYAKEAVGLEESQAYKYAKIYENLPEDFFHSSAKIGVSKLALLAGITEDKRAEILEENDVEKISVSELRKLLNDSEEKITELEGEKERLDSEINQYMTDDLAVRQKAKSEIEALKASNAELEKQIEKIKSEKQEEKVIEKTVEVKVDDDKSKKTIVELENKIKKSRETIAELEKKVATSSELLIKFKSKFADWQSFGNALIEMLAEMGEEEREKCKAAFTAVIERWKK